MSKFTKNSLDRLARQTAREYRKSKNPEQDYRGSIAKVDFWEIIIGNNVHNGLSEICFRIYLTNDDFINVAI